MNSAFPQTVAQVCIMVLYNSMIQCC